MRFLVRWFYSTVCVLLGITVVAFFGAFAGLFYFGKGLPDHHTLERYNPNVSSTVFLENGELLREFSLEKRSFVSIDRIPDRLKKAFLAAEDKNFYEHMGVDPISIIRSLFNNFVNLGSSRRPQGASTITQQVARIFLIGNNEVKYERKIREAILAFRVENSLSKDKILELYLNQIYLGSGAYGVAAAAKCYFGKSVDELDIAECAMLAALAKGAAHYSPVTHYDRAKERRNWVLKRELESGFITEEEYKSAVADELMLSINHEDNRADYYAEEVRKEIHKKCSIKSVSKDGLVIRVPLNIDMQRAAEQALKAGLERIDRTYSWRGPIAHISFDGKKRDDSIQNLKQIKKPLGAGDFELGIIVPNNRVLLQDKTVYALSKSDINWIGTFPKKTKVGDVVLCSRTGKNLVALKQVPQVQGAIVVMNPHTGKVLAMQGGYSFNVSKFNRVTQAQRQPGSVFKPIVYLTALNAGFSPSSVIDGSPISIMVGSTVWEPKNFKNEIVGDVTLRAGIERSLNTVTVKLAQHVGISNIAAMSEKLGVYNKAYGVWSIVLGAVETNLLRLVNAYCIIANGGKRVIPILIDQIQNKHGETIYRSERVDTSFIQGVGYDSPQPPNFQINFRQILDERSAYQLVSLLIGSVQNGTSRGAKILGIPLAGKTGTSNDSKDNWFIGFTPNLVVGVLVCFDDSTKSLGKNATGASNALPIFVDFMKRAKLDKNKIPFKVPSGITFHYVNKTTGRKCKMSDPGAFLEAFKTEDHVDEIVITDSQTDNSESNLYEVDSSLNGIY